MFFRKCPVHPSQFGILDIERKNLKKEGAAHGSRLFFWLNSPISGRDRIREMHDWQCFKTFKQRGEWVELQFMAQAALRGFSLSKPWGDCSAYDVGIEHESHFLRVQVKSTTCKTQFGYLCQFKPCPHGRPYTLDQVDMFAAYVIPEDVWYLIPAAVLLRGHGQKAVTLFPIEAKHPARYRYESYRAAWTLLSKSRDDLCGTDTPVRCL